MKRIQEALNEKILILDGPMGTMIQNENLKEEDFRGKKFESSSISLKGNNDILNLTQEKIIYDIHTKYLSAGADISMIFTLIVEQQWEKLNLAVETFQNTSMMIRYSNLPAISA